MFNQPKFAARITALMEETQETGVDLAKLVDVTPATVSRYAAGKMKPKVVVVEKIAQHYGVDPYWLMGQDVGREPKEQPPRPIPVFTSAPFDETNRTDEIYYVRANEKLSFAYRARDDAMKDLGIPKDAVVLIERTKTLEKGDLALFQVTATPMVRVYNEDGVGVVLTGGRDVTPEVFRGEKRKSLQIIGKIKYIVIEVI